MNKTVYGIGGSDGGNVIVLTPDQIPVCSTPSTLTPQLLTSYINRANTLLNTLVSTRPPLEQTLNRLDVIRQELCVLTSKQYRSLPPPPQIGISAQPTNGKITIQSSIV